MRRRQLQTSSWLLCQDSGTSPVLCLSDHPVAGKTKATLIRLLLFPTWLQIYLMWKSGRSWGICWPSPPIGHTSLQVKAKEQDKESFHPLLMFLSSCRSKALEVVEGDAVCRWCSNQGVDGLSCVKCDARFCRKVYLPSFQPVKLDVILILSASTLTWERGSSSWPPPRKETGPACSANRRLLKSWDPVS